MRRFIHMALFAAASPLAGGFGSAQQTTTIIISGFAEGIDELFLSFGEYASPCGTYFDNSSGFCCAGSSATLFAGDSAAGAAGQLRNAVNFGSGLSATSNGNILKVTSPLGTEVALASFFQSNSCAGMTNPSLRLDGCVINNVSNGIPCDENMPHVSGFTFVGGNTTFAAELATDPTLLDSGGSPHDGPQLGNPAEPFNISIDCTGASGPGLYALHLGLNTRAVPLSTDLGLLYLDRPTLFRTHGTHSQSVANWFEPPGVTLPNDPAFAGLSYYVQGICDVFSPAGRLSDAIEQTIR